MTHLATRICRAAIACALSLAVALQGVPVQPAAAAGTLPGTQVIDYSGSFRSSTPSRLRSADVGIAVRYVGAAKWKSLTRWEANALRKNGIDIAMIYETKANWMLGGWGAGVSAAKKARAASIACGGPRTPFLYLACDVDTHNYARVTACLRGAASVLGASHVGIYGSYDVCDNALRAGAAAKAWQTEAWSHGRVLPGAALFQTAKRFNGWLGVDYDSNNLRTDDIGQWGYMGVAGFTITQQGVPAGAGLSAIDFVGASGWAVGDGGTVLRTTDGGVTWGASTAETTASLRAVRFADAATGWAVGDGGVIVRTSDGGSTWTTQTAETTAALAGIDVADANTAWAVGSGGIVARTTDAGASWTTATAGTSEDLNAVEFVGASGSGWAVGAGGTVAHTGDAGASWAPQSVPTTVTLRAVQFLGDGATGWAVGDGGTILHTSDGGSSWARQSIDTTADFASVHFADPSSGWAVGRDGAVARTSDGGYTWTSQTSSTDADLLGVRFTDANHGWAVGAGGTLLRIAKTQPEAFGTLAGAVMDAATGAPVTDAKVAFSRVQGTPTAVDGSFVAARVPPGTYTVTVTSPRYITTSVSGVVVSAGGTARVTLRPVAKTPTTIACPSIVTTTPVRGQPISIVSTLTPSSATSAAVPALYFARSEWKWTWRKVHGKRRRVKTWYWRQRNVVPMRGDSTGALSATVWLPPGKWRVYARYPGAPTFLPSGTGLCYFTVR